ncbi:MAG: DUF455 family protein [Deltaproteobacteria bacterium]|nr:DUF455 family protein [Deltaproteobacteria bacterium]
MTVLRQDPTVHPATLEQWALDWLATDTLEAKRTLGPIPDAIASDFAPRRDVRPSRPHPLVVTDRAERLGTHPQAMRDPRRRAAHLHAFVHHELQAAELFMWAIVTWPDAPLAFRRGLAKIAQDEVRHLDLYLQRIEALGFHWGSFAVRDWFWQRLAHAPTPAHLVATLGLGFEGANLDHVSRFKTLYENAGDHESAEVIARVGEEELPHVRFARHWFEKFTGSIAADVWQAHLISPISPMLLRGATLDRAARLRANMPAEIIDAIEHYVPHPPARLSDDLPKSP